MWVVWERRAPLLWPTFPFRPPSSSSLMSSFSCAVPIKLLLSLFLLVFLLIYCFIPGPACAPPTGFRRAALANLLLSPFLLVFLLIYFFMHNAERFYSHPGALGSRRWSALAKWRLRELNELQHYLQHRCEGGVRKGWRRCGKGVRNVWH